VFVHAGSESDGIGKTKTEQLDRQVSSAEEPIQRAANGFVAAHPGQAAHCPIVGLFSLLREQEWADELVQDLQGFDLGYNGCGVDAVLGE